MTFAKAIAKEKGIHKPSKSPQIYMREFKQVILDLVNSDNDEVRNAVCGHVYCPTKMLTERLMIEENETIIKTILLNSKTPFSAIERFASEREEIANQFTTDSEVMAKLNS